jgi:hypothetical protein
LHRRPRCGPPWPPPWPAGRGVMLSARVGTERRVPPRPPRTCSQPWKYPRSRLRSQPRDQRTLIIAAYRNGRTIVIVSTTPGAAISAYLADHGLADSHSRSFASPARRGKK